MIEPKKISLALSQKSPSGFSAYTPSQVADIAISEDSFLGSKIRRAMELGATKEQAIKYYAYGTSNGPLPEKKKTGFFDRIAESVQGRRVQVGQEIEDFKNSPPGASSQLRSASELALRVPGQAALAAGDMIGGLASPIIQKAPEIVSKTLAGFGVPEQVTQAQFKASGKILEPFSDAVRGGLKYYQGIDQDTRKDIESMAALGLASLDIVPGATSAPKVAKELVGETAEGLVKTVARPKTVADMIGEVDSVVGKIVQGDKFSLDSAKKALQLVDTNGVKTYKDLNSILKKKVSSIATKQNDILDAVQGKHTIDSFAKTSKAGTHTATANPVANALEHLQEQYIKTGNIDDYVRIKALKEVAETEGLTARQVNDLAREYGAESPKAFNPRTGDPLTSVNAQLAENTRAGVKDAARALLPDDTSKLLDTQMSNIFDTLRNTEIVEQKVMNLAQKVSQRGIVERVGR